MNPRKVMIIMEKELTQIFRDKVMLAISFLAPFFLVFLFGFLYIEQKVTDVPIIIYDQDQSEISRSLIRSFGESERFRIIGQVESYAEMGQLIQTEKAYMAVVFPPHLKEAVKSGRSTEVGLILNGTNILIMNTLANAANQIIQTASAGITMRIMQGHGISKAQAYQAVTAVNFRTRVWFNPTLSYLAFMLLGLIGTAIQQVTFLGVALSFAKEREQGTWKQLLLAKVTEREIITGKVLLYLIIFLIDAVLMYLIGIYFFNLPMRGNALLLIFTTCLFMLALVVMGIVISILAPTTAQAIEISMMIAVPSFLISGYTWPLFSMPLPIQYLSSLLPLTHFLEAIKSIVLMGSGFRIIWPNLIILALFSVVFLPIAYFALKQRMRKG